MINIPSTPRSLMDLLGLSVRYHFATFRRMIPLIIYIVIVKDAYVYLGGMPSNPYLYALVSLVMTVLFIYLIVAMLHLSNRILHSEYSDWRSALSDVRPYLGKVFLVFVIFVVVLALLFMLAHWITGLIQAGRAHPSQYAGLLLTLAVGIPVMLAYLRFFYTIPLIVMEELPLKAAFKKAGQLCSGKENWLRVFSVYAFGVAIWLLVSPDTLHGHFMKMYKVSAIFDLVVFCVTLPIMMNFVVLMRNELALRNELSNSEE